MENKALEVRGGQIKVSYAVLKSVDSSASPCLLNFLEPWKPFCQRILQGHSIYKTKLNLLKRGEVGVTQERISQCCLLFSPSSRHNSSKKPTPVGLKPNADCNGGHTDNGKMEGCDQICCLGVKLPGGIGWDGLLAEKLVGWVMEEMLRT